MQSLVRCFAHRGPLNRPIHTAPKLRSLRMSATAYSELKPDGEPTSTASTRSNSTSKTEPLALPETPHNPSTQLDMSNGGTTIKLNHLGPMVVNIDGSLGRISNWEGMTDMEKKNTLRIIGKRNQSRLEALRAKENGN